MIRALPRRVVVTGVGAVSPLGLGARRSWNNLLQNKCAIQAVTAEHGDFSKNECRVAGLVPQGSFSGGGWQVLEWLRKDDQRKLAKFMQYATVAAQEALGDADWLPKDPKDCEATGVAIGSGIGAFEDVYETSIVFHKHGPKKVSPYFVPRLLINLAAGHVAMKHGFKGPNHSASTACTTGAHSIGDAARFICLGDADVMVAGGAESCIHPLAFTGFERSRSLVTDSNDDPEKASRPFSQGRGGFVIGEGAAMLVLEELEHAINRNAKIYAEIAGYGISADAHHITHPPEDGDGAFKAMQKALQSAGKRPFDVDYVNAHATSTPLGDIAEAMAISNLLQSDTDGAANLSMQRGPHISSTKGATGHLLGAAGATEALFCVMAIEDGKIPGTLNLLHEDPSLPKLSYLRETVEKKVDTILTNSFGFGGTNASLCLTKYNG